MAEDNGKLLYVEDNEAVAREVRELLSEFGFSVVLASSTDEARARLSATRFDLAIVDVDLGHGDRGLDVGLPLIEEGQAVLFVSGYDRSEILEMPSGVPFLQKPLTSDALIAAIHNAIDPKK